MVIIFVIASNYVTYKKKHSYVPQCSEPPTDISEVLGSIPYI